MKPIKVLHGDTVDANLKYSTVTEATQDLAEILLSQPTATTRNGEAQELLFPRVTLTNPRMRANLAAGRKASLPAQIYETVWVLRGLDHLDVLAKYLPRAYDFSDDGQTWRAAYGPRLRHAAGPFNSPTVDPLANVIQELKDHPGSRRAVIGIWNNREDSGVDSLDLPCNDTLHFLAYEGQLDLHVFTRSNDLIWGWSGINTFEWSTLLEIVAWYTGLQVGSVHYSISNLHLYGHHAAKAQRIVDGSTDSLDLGLQPGPAFNPGLSPRSTAFLHFNSLLDEWLEIETQIRTGNNSGVFGMALDSRINQVPEPMLRSWLRILRWWWSGDWQHTASLAGTDLRSGAALSPKNKNLNVSGAIKQRIDIDPRILGGSYVSIEDEKGVFKIPNDAIKGMSANQDTLPGLDSTTLKVTYTDKAPTFRDYVVRLHDDKHEAYGNSWKKRGEVLSIQANIARKIDRLVAGKDTDDETQLDTAIDLMVYLAKYITWRWERGLCYLPREIGKGHWVQKGASDRTDFTDELLRNADTRINLNEWSLIDRLNLNFDQLIAIENDDIDSEESKTAILNHMFPLAASLAQRRWWTAQNAHRSWNPEAGQK